MLRYFISSFSPVLTFIIVDDDDGNPNDGQITTPEEVSPVQVCVQLSGGIPSNPVTINMNGIPSVAVGKLFKGRHRANLCTSFSTQQLLTSSCNLEHSLSLQTVQLAQRGVGLS